MTCSQFSGESLGAGSEVSAGWRRPCPVGLRAGGTNHITIADPKGRVAQTLPVGLRARGAIHKKTADPKGLRQPGRED